MKAKDIETKRLIYDFGIDEIYKNAKKALYKGDRSQMDDFLASYGDDIARVCENLSQSRCRAVRTTRRKVGRAIRSGNAYFGTLTFKDEVLENTTEETRRTYVARELKAIGFKYVANIDYGGENGREHYHFILEPLPFMLATWKNGEREYVDMPDLQNWCEKYGFVSIEKIGDTEKDEKKVAKYTAKLSAHALKRSTMQGSKRPRLIYSRRQF